MNTKKELTEKALKYMEMIETAQNRIFSHENELKGIKDNGFDVWNRTKYYEKMIPFYKEVMKRLDNRVNTLLQKAIQQKF